MKRLTQMMKDEIHRKREAEKVFHLIHPMVRTKYPAMRRKTLILPEELKGRELKKIIKGKKKRNSEYKSLVVKQSKL